MAAKKPKSLEKQSGVELGQRLLESVRQMNAGKFARITQMPVNEVAEARIRTGLSQAEFASALSISKRTLQEWEQGRRNPSGAAQALIRIANKHPKIVRATLQEA
jgi:putative transcriptional regulator